ncbi:Protein arginine N-methyltransferase 2 [Madurella mycetomatis]|uniref:Protein arginine N-methyltransferase 2 n=1 Tax=Madurella mycetomatis TaxID=100816 RepID=A0A175W4Q5_9PEZI|nr:Protein arginine N-methyltransferase 2 [Madurella mycetomatis]
MPDPSPAPPPDDSISARISPDCPAETQRVLTAAWSHDVAAVKKLLDEPGRASCQDPKTGETPLHAAIRACGPPSNEDDPGDLENAKKTVYELLMWGGIWNDVDDRNETPGCVAHRLGRGELYNLCVEAGVRAEMLFGVMDGYEELGSDVGEEMEVVEAEGDVNGGEEDVVVVGENGDEVPELVDVDEANGRGKEDGGEKENGFQPPNNEAAVNVNSEAYLRSKLTYSEGKLVDEDGNGVMMAWETDIMRRSVDALLPAKERGNEF